MSLIELLVVVSVIGIITSILVPNIGNISTQARFAKDQRNAQNIASLVASAKGAGATNNWTNAEQVIDDLQNSISVPGPAGTLEFRISPLSEGERQGAASNLIVSGGMVYYSASSQ